MAFQDAISLKILVPLSLECKYKTIQQYENFPPAADGRRRSVDVSAVIVHTERAAQY